MSKALRIPSNDLLKFVNLQDKKRGMTALHYGCEEGHSEVAEFLVFSVKMDKNEESLEKKTALDYAEEKGHKNIISWLSEL